MVGKMRTPLALFGSFSPSAISLSRLKCNIEVGFGVDFTEQMSELFTRFWARTEEVQKP